MAVNMSNVKQIMHNNKEVIKIEDSSGHIIWQKIAAQPFRRLEYIAFDGTNYCDSAEHNANNRAYRLDYIQTGWNDSGLCYPFGIWTSTDPQNILLTRNERSNTSRGFEVCRVGNSAFGTNRPDAYMNNRMVAEMRWGTNTTVYYRLRYKSSYSYVRNSSGNASGRTGTNTGNFFIGAINDGGGGTHNNANGMLVGRIYEVAIAGSNSFSDYNYYYVPCQRKSDGAIGFKQPHLTGEDSFHPLRNKSDGSIVTNISSHMGPVVEEDWDGVTYPIEQPYRRLEYIKFNGAEYVDTVKSITTSDINQGIIEFKIHVKYNNITDWNVMGYDTSSGNTRFNLGVNGSGYSRFGVADVGTWQDSEGFKLNTSITYFAVVGYNANNSQKGYYWNDNRGTIPLRTNALSPTGNLYIGAANYDGSPSSYGNCWIYQSEIAVGGTENYVAMMIPCQRKSDNRCGLYDTVRQLFLPMNGTITTTDAAGPVAEENWDPTAAL